MRKVIIKTAIITFVSVIICTVLAFSLLSIFAPGKMADFTGELGMDKASLSFSVRKYERSDDISDLHTILYKASELENYALLAEYSKEMTTRSDFLTYANSQEVGYKEYVFTNYIVALLEISSNEVFAEASRLYDDYYSSYEDDNPLYMLIRFSSDYDDDFSAKFEGQNTALSDLSFIKLIRYS